MNRKFFTLALILAVAALSLAACMNADVDTRTNPAPTANYSPDFADGDANTNNGDRNGVKAPSSDTDNSGAVRGGVANNNGAAGNTSSVSNGALGAFDWANSAADVEKAIAGISEIADSRVVVTNSTALVGVKFDNAYKGELTERIREMVSAEVLRADPAIQTVAVTSAAEDVDKVYALSEAIRAGRTADELSADINAIVRNATTLR